MTMPSKPFKLWAKRLAAYAQGEPIPESHINALCALVRGTKRSAMDDGESFDIVSKVDANPDGVAMVRSPLGWAISPKQAEKGLAWMRSTGFKAIVKVYTDGPKVRAARQALEAFDHWTFDGLFIIELGHGRMDARPVYTMHGTDGASLSYCAYPWQTGMTIEILECEVSNG